MVNFDGKIYFNHWFYNFLMLIGFDFNLAADKREFANHPTTEITNKASSNLSNDFPSHSVPSRALVFGSPPIMWHHPLPGPRFNIKISPYQYRKSHCGDKTVIRSSYLRNGISYTGKKSSLYWIRALADLSLAVRDNSLVCKIKVNSVWPSDAIHFLPYPKDLISNVWGDKSNWWIGHWEFSSACQCIIKIFGKLKRGGSSVLQLMLLSFAVISLRIHI